MKVLFAGCGDIGVRAIRTLSDNSLYDHWQTLAMRRKPSALPSDIDAIQGELCDSENFLSILDNTNVDVSIFGTGKFYKEQMNVKKENIYSNIDDMLNQSLKSEDE